VTESGVTRPAGERSALAGVFVISVAILALEILQIRILSVQMWYHHAYVVVTLTMLGFAAAAVVVTLRPSLTRGAVAGRLALFSTLFGVAAILAQLLLTRAADHLKPLTAEGVFGPLLLFYCLLVLPWYFGGLVVAIALTATERIHKRYFVNLVGSALGAWVFIAAITPLGGEHLLVACAALGPVAALCFLGRERAMGTRLLALAALAAAVPLYLNAESWFEVKIGAGKLRSPTVKHLERRWTPLTCLDVFATTPENPRTLQILQDGGAGTLMHSGVTWFPKALLSPQSMVYVPAVRRVREGAPAPSVAAIGIGGGADLRIAKDYGASRVLGIEINEQMVRLTRDDYANFNGGIGQLPGVELVMGEGRSTLRRLDETFDIIQISGADTYTSPNSGSFVLMESYLYTSEAIRDYLDHLKPDGVLGIMRFSDDPPWETVRLFAMGLLELRARGIREPSKHAVAIESQYSGTCLFSLQRFEAEDIEFYRGAGDPANGDYTLYYVPGLEATQANEFTELARAVDEGREEDFFRAYPVDVRPVFDDSPFFYNFHHVTGSWELEPSSFSKEFDIQFPVAPKVLGTLLLQTSLLVFAMVLLPLLVLRRRGLGAGHAGRHLVFFVAVGMAFMFLEISAIQRLALFLGHPVYSTTVVLFSFLFFAGLGSLWAGRFAARPTRALRVAVAVLVALILGLNLVLQPLLDAALYLELPLRIVIAVGLLAPMNLLMGMPFPLALGRLQRAQPELVPWALGANGGASVIGSVLCVMVAMETGFFTVSLISAGLYLVALLAATTGPLAGESAAS
jgi:SAM-dependent methyltransferase